MIVNHLKSQKGFTLLELLISIAMLSFVFVAAASYITTTLRLSQLNQHTVIAVYLAEELLEWLDTEQEANWDSFVAQADTSGTTYCFNDQITYQSSWPSSGDCATSGNDFQGVSGNQPTIYNREVILTSYGTPATRVQATVRVFWRELGNEHDVTFERVFSLYQQ